MTKLNSGDLTLPYFEVEAQHPVLGYSVNLLVPARAKERPAVKLFMDGKYYEPFTHLSFQKILTYKNGGNVIHAGTFFGDMLDTLSRNADKVYAFEPVLDNYYFAKTNLQRLGHQNVILMNAGLSDKTTLASIVTENRQGNFLGGGSRIRNAQNPTKLKSEMVPVFKIDDLPISDISLLQLDVEGHEKRALEGAARLIDRDKPIVLIEDNNRDCGEFLTARGYHFAFMHNGLNYWAVENDIGFLKGLRSIT